MTTTTPIPPLTNRHALAAGRTAAGLWLAARAMSLVGDLAAVGLVLWAATVLARPSTPHAEPVLIGLFLAVPALALLCRRIDRTAQLHTPGSMAPSTPDDPAPAVGFFLPGLIAHALRVALAASAVWWALRGPMSGPLADHQVRWMLAMVGTVLICCALYLAAASGVRAALRLARRERTPALPHLHSLLSVLHAAGLAALILTGLAAYPPTPQLRSAVELGVTLAAFIAGLALTASLLRRTAAAQQSQRSTDAAGRPWAGQLTEHLLVLRGGDATLEQLQRWTPLVRVTAITAFAAVAVGLLWVATAAPWLIAVPAVLLLPWAWGNRAYLRAQLRFYTTAPQSSLHLDAQPHA